jgi:replicative DNA helicase
MIRQYEVRTPPHSVEAEQAVLGGLMLDPTASGSVLCSTRKHCWHLRGARRC